MIRVSLPPNRSHPPRGEPMFHRILDADTTAVQQALMDVRARFEGTVPDDALARTELVLAEVLNNIAQHGTGTGKEPLPGGPPRRTVTIHLTVTRHAGGLACAVTDDGPPLPTDCLAEPDHLPSPELSAAKRCAVPRLLVGSNATHPMPSKRTSGQAWSCAVVA